MTSEIEFLGIGAQRAGTTWLWSKLRGHPGIWMPPEKELHYFDRALRYPSSNVLASDSLLERLLSRTRHNREFRRSCSAQLRRVARLRDWALLRWYLRYYLGRRDDTWYLSLFAAGRGRVRGEITPAYAMLERADVARIRQLLPRLKILFLLRNPIDRAWSHIRFESMQGRFPAIDDLGQVRTLLEHPGFTLRNDYLRTLAIWESEFPLDQLLVAFYDDIVAQPAVLLQNVFVFLGVESKSERAVAGEKAVLASLKRPMPDKIRQYLALKYLPALEQLAIRFGGHAERWRADAAASPKSEAS